MMTIIRLKLSRLCMHVSLLHCIVYVYRQLTTINLTWDLFDDCTCRLSRFDTMAVKCEMQARVLICLIWGAVEYGMQRPYRFCLCAYTDMLYSS